MSVQQYNSNKKKSPAFAELFAEREGFALGPKGRLRNEVEQEPPTVG